MATIHFILQGKGGVGKSMVASMIFQHFMEEGYNVLGYDTDPVNKTLSSYKEFQNITSINILQDDGDNIDSRKFDLLYEELYENSDENTHIIIDNGASSFLALGAYIRDNNMLEELEQKHTVYLHTIITGGQALFDTLTGLASLAKNFPNSNIITWLNPYFGKIGTDNSPTFYDLNVYRDFGDKIKSVIELPIGNKDLIGKDLEMLFAKKQSFQSGINGSNPIAIKSRLKKYWTDMKNRIDNAYIF